MKVVKLKIINKKKSLLINWNNGKKTRFHSIWLRYNSNDSQTRSKQNGQRLITLNDIDQNILIESAVFDKISLKIKFSTEERYFDFQQSWLIENIYDVEKNNKEKGWTSEYIRIWNSQFSKNFKTSEFNNLKTNKEELKKWLTSIHKYGFAKISGGPLRSGSLMEIVKLFGYERSTNYGKWFDVRSEINPSNLAYTGMKLQGHTDNPYRDPVPTLQILYCLENSALGGNSFVTDGFNVAKRLSEEFPEGFELLSKYPARFEFRGAEGIWLYAKKPVIELSTLDELIAVRFNNRSLEPVLDVPYKHMENYYKAYRRFGELVNDPSMSISFKLEPGESFIVDNTRVLHAREAYSGNGTRWLQGCYADKDSMLSTLNSLTNFNNVEVL